MVADGKFFSRYAYCERIVAQSQSSKSFVTTGWSRIEITLRKYVGARNEKNLNP